MLEHIHVNYKLYNTDFTIQKALHKLDDLPMISYDCETQALYSIEEKAEAKDLLKGDLSYEDKKLCKLVARSSGLSNPRLIKVTHFIFGLSKSESIICIANNRRTEIMIFNWLSKFKGKVIIHNSLFDLKIMYERIGKLPLDYEDSMLLAKTLINNVDDWQAKVGLKDLMESQFDPKWSLFANYDVVNLKDKAMLDYAAIDGAATYKLWEDIQETIKEQNETN